MNYFFIQKIEANKAEFVQKITQNDLFYTQAQMMLACTVPSNSSINSKNTELTNTGKTFMDILQEKVYTDKYRIFEEFVAGVFKAIFEEFPVFLANEAPGKFKEDIPVSFKSLFLEPDLERCKDLFVEQKIKNYMQGDSIKNAIERLETTFFMPDILPKKDKNGAITTENWIKELSKCYHFSLIRNMITHNNGEINQIYCVGVQKNKIAEFGIEICGLNDKVSSKLESLIAAAGQCFDTLADKICEILKTNEQKLSKYLEDNRTKFN